MTPAAIERLKIVIRGVAERTTSSVDGLVEELRTAGVSDDVIKRRIMDELESGPVLAEMRRFATARAPGVPTEMVFRFARDTLAREQATADQKRAAQDEIDAKRRANLDMFDRIEAELRERDEQGATDDQILATAAAIDEQGVDTSAWMMDEMPEPPPDAPLDEEYLWVAVEDRSTCEICAGNHGEVKTLGEWVEIGEPRSGACLGDANCRCVLVPISATTPEQREAITAAGPITT